MSEGAIPGLPPVGPLSVRVTATGDREAGRRRGDAEADAFRKALAEQDERKGASGSKPAAKPVPVPPVPRALQNGGGPGRKDSGDGLRHVDVWA